MVKLLGLLGRAPERVLEWAPMLAPKLGPG